MIFKTLLTVFLPLSGALPWDGPKATVKPELGSVQFFKRNQYGIAPVAAWSPIPTRKPRELFDGYALLKRQSGLSSLSKSSSYSNDTCGFQGGDIVNSVTCDLGYTCAIATSQNVWACCATPSACQIQTTCIPQSELLSCAGNNACPGDNYATKCNTLRPFCNQEVLIGEENLSATLWYCGSVPSVETIYATATDGGKSSASFVFITMVIVSQAVSSSSSPTPIPSSTSPSSSTSPRSSPAPSSSIPVATPSSNPTPIGPIVGGSIGGFAVIAAVAFGIFFILRSRKKDNGPGPSVKQHGKVAPGTAPTAAEGATSNGQPQQAEKEYYHAQAAPVSPQPPQHPRLSQVPAYAPSTAPEAYIPYFPPGSPPLAGPAPQDQQQIPLINYPHELTEVDGTTMSSRARPGLY